MKTISQRQLRNDNAEIMSGVERGETYTVTRRGVPVARLASELDATQPDLAACYLLETEVRRIAHCVEALTQEHASAVLDGVDLHEVPPSLFREAGILSGRNVRSGDAIHLTAAIRMGVDAVLTYDTRMTAAARELGLDVVAPGVRCS